MCVYISIVSRDNSFVREITVNCCEYEDLIITYVVGKRCYMRRLKITFAPNKYFIKFFVKKNLYSSHRESNANQMRAIQNI